MNLCSMPFVYEGQKMLIPENGTNTTAKKQKYIKKDNFFCFKSYFKIHKA